MRLCLRAMVEMCAIVEEMQNAEEALRQEIAELREDVTRLRQQVATGHAAAAAASRDNGPSPPIRFSLDGIPRPRKPAPPRGFESPEDDSEEACDFDGVIVDLPLRTRSSAASGTGT